ncbi:hypothetical protein POX_b02584 [Penicillium oxalicum]|uniref:Uncharacterized protein n=1 Tax=Penicillium oxalicum (strain 114-2 / CGMCC 5302) TaxID=933388 RepID=S8B6V4_PENO1|nr:hypothetical protein POX_b02584 [Penicillium oxalicum]EPS30407.1 hypothetical protein PDE_05358 [Penicillium oxalicum 114-2]KAI2792546.1 hypothetical protein POX_b02584 [Penicillium oxalicum]
MDDHWVPRILGPIAITAHTECILDTTFVLYTCSINVGIEDASRSQQESPKFRGPFHPKYPSLPIVHTFRTASASTRKLRYDDTAQLKLGPNISVSLVSAAAFFSFPHPPGERESKTLLLLVPLLPSSSSFSPPLLFFYQALFLSSSSFSFGQFVECAESGPTDRELESFRLPFFCQSHLDLLSSRIPSSITTILPILDVC